MDRETARSMLANMRGLYRGGHGSPEGSNSMALATANGAREKILTLGRPEWLVFIANVLSSYESVSTEIGGEHAMERLASKFDSRHGRNCPWRLCICEVELATEAGQKALGMIKDIRKMSRSTFIAVWSPTAAENAAARLACLELGANMVTQCPESLLRAAERVTRPSGRGSLECVACGLANLTEDELWEHYPLFHVNHESISCHCHICHSRVSHVSSPALIFLLFPLFQRFRFPCHE